MKLVSQACFNWAIWQRHGPHNLIYHKSQIPSYYCFYLEYVHWHQWNSWLTLVHKRTTRISVSAVVPKFVEFAAFVKGNSVQRSKTHGPNLALVRLLITWNWRQLLQHKCKDLMAVHIEGKYSTSCEIWFMISIHKSKVNLWNRPLTLCCN